jgi:hypothetical protein
MQPKKTLVCWVVETRGIPGAGWQNNLRQKFTTRQQAFLAMDAELANWKNPDPKDARVVEYTQSWAVVPRPTTKA